MARDSEILECVKHRWSRQEIVGELTVAKNQ